MSYNIHDILKFKIINNDIRLNRLFDNISSEYKNFESDDCCDSDLIFHLGDFSPSNQGCRILDNEYYVKEDYFYCKDSYKIAKWKFEMQGFEKGVTDIRISTNLFGYMVISGFIIDLLITFKLNEKGYPVIHGSCISEADQAHIFTAQSGSGKTLTALYAIENGFEFLADDYVILNKNRALSFISPLNICKFNYAPIIEKNLNIKSKIEFHLKDILFQLSGLRITTKINIKDITPPSLNDDSNLKSIFMLVPKNKFDIVKIDKNELIGNLVSNLMLDNFPFSKYMMEYSYVFPLSGLAKHWIRYEENLRMNLNDSIVIYKVEVPKMYDRETFNMIRTYLNKF